MSEGLVQALLVPLRGEALGYTLGFAFAGIFLSLFAYVGVVVWLVVALVYSGCSAFFGACLAGARDGNLEPQRADVVPDGGLTALALPGLAVLFYVLLLIGLGAVLATLTGVDVTYPTAAQQVWLTCLVFVSTLPFAAGMTLLRSWQTPLALIHVPAQLAVMRAAGVQYLVPALVAMFVASVPMTLIMWAYELGFVARFVVMAASCATTGYAFGATGAAMGWIAYHNDDVADILDAS